MGVSLGVDMGVNDGAYLGLANPDLKNEDLEHAKEVAVVALVDGMAPIEHVERMEAIYADKREARLRLIREEEASYSEERSFMDHEGTIWVYVTVRDEYVRIVGCKTQVERLEIPSRIADLPVADVAVDACSYIESVREIVCSPSIERIEKCAFRGCKNLERLVLPRELDAYESSWVRGCRKLRDLTLPGRLQRVTATVFDEGDVKSLAIGCDTAEFAPGMFVQGRLEHISIDAGNPHITTDGVAIYAHDGAHLRALAIECESYVVAPGCQQIEHKAFANRSGLYSVDLPDSLIRIDDYAFSHSGITEFDAPAHLRSIGARAFFQCRNLVEVTLNEGIVHIGDDAFTATGITSLRLPASLEELGKNFAGETFIRFSGDDASFSIASGGSFELDSAGGMYRSASDGKHLVRMLDDKVREYAVKPGTTVIDSHAFAHHYEIQRVDLPEGLVRIDDAAFKDCRNLAIADFPSTLEHVGDEAFLDTSLARVHIPRGLRHLGTTALITEGAHNGDCAPALTSIDVDEGNPRFCTASGLLIERNEDGESTIVVYADGTESVRIPDDVVGIDPYAFGGARHLRELYLSDRIRRIGIRALSIDCFLEHIHVDLADPYEGQDSFDFYFPDTPRSAHELQLAFNLSNSVDLARLFKHYDSAIANMHEFDSLAGGTPEKVDEYSQAKFAIDRLVNPVLMSSTNKILLTQLLTNNLEAVCEAIARHDDRQAIDDLLDLGILNKDNLLDVIERIAKLQDAAMTGYLLEIKRRLFKRSAMDFEL